MIRRLSKMLSIGKDGLAAAVDFSNTMLAGSRKSFVHYLYVVLEVHSAV